MVLAGIEQIFFEEACIMLGFGYWVKIVVIAVMILVVAELCILSRSFVFLILPCQQGAWGA